MTQVISKNKISSETIRWRTPRLGLAPISQRRYLVQPTRAGLQLRLVLESFPSILVIRISRSGAEKPSKHVIFLPADRTSCWGERDQTKTAGTAPVRRGRFRRVGESTPHGRTRREVEATRRRKISRGPLSRCQRQGIAVDELGLRTRAQGRNRAGDRIPLNERN